MSSKSAEDKKKTDVAAESNQVDNSAGEVELASEMEADESTKTEATEEVAIQPEVSARIEAAAQSDTPVRPEATGLAQTVMSHLAHSVGKQSGERNWYVIHTYAGYEDQVAQNLRQRIESLNMGDKIYDVMVPTEKQVEIKGGKRRVVEKKIFPGYVMVDMLVTDDSWYVVRNTPNVTGFIGFGVRPTPMSKEELDVILKRMGQDEPSYNVDLQAGDLVQINDGALKGFQAKVEEVDGQKGKVRILVSMFGRETPVSLDYLQIKKI